MIVLVGFMGAGKSSVGRALAGLLGSEFVDTDRAAELSAGRSIAEIFEADGEPAFRDLEAGVVAEALEGEAKIVALGGGALQDARTRGLLRARVDAAVVYLEVGFEEAVERANHGETRPLLQRPGLRTLYDERSKVYDSVASLRFSTSGRTPDEVAHEIADSLGRGVKRIMVSSASGPYNVVVGRDLCRVLALLVPGLGGAEKALFVTHPSLVPAAADGFSSLEHAGVEVSVHEVPEGEPHKSLETAARLYREFAEGAAHRNDVVIGFGGGVVADLAGFVASTFNRGMPLVQVPTSLLAQVDAAIGGKNGVNLPHGKNLVGTFYAPRVVVADVLLLRTLPADELRSGMAEVIKYGLISDPGLLDFVQDRAQEILDGDPDALERIVARSAAIKAEVVSGDEREAGRRATLNYGHTFGHAIEAAAGYEGIRHGEAISIGMMAAAHLACELERIDEGEVASHRKALEAFGLPVTADLEIEALEAAWLRDKKYEGGVRFVLLAGPGRPEPGVAAPRQAIAKALERLRS